MRRLALPLSPVFSLAVLAMGCSSPATQLVVVVDTDLRIPAELDALEITVTPAVGEPHVRQEMLDGTDPAPFTVGVAPAGDSLGPIHVRATGHLDGALVVARSARTTLVRGETRTLILHLVRACIAMTCPTGSTCVEPGVCRDIDDPTVLPWTGHPPRLFEDGGLPPDSGGVDGGVPDSGVDCRSTGCEDDNPCTDDVCGAEHRCVHTPSDSACDDGVFCNGLDQCVGGTCSAHTGDACAAPTTCDEAGEVCLGCENSADCPAPLAGAWSGCTHATDICATTGTETRTVRTFTCALSRCEPTDGSEMQACTRTTAGATCATTECGGYGPCTGGASDVCGAAGVATRSCTDYACAGGACMPQSRAEGMACMRSTDGASCGSISCGGWGGCGDFANACTLSGTETRACTTPVCSGGACGSMPSTESRACTRSSTDGAACPGTTTCGAWGACSFTDACGTTGTHTRTCNDPVCSGGSCGGPARTETEACTRGSTDGTSCGADTCGAFGACTGFSTICDEDGTYSRTCSVQQCLSGACTSVSPYTDTQACMRSRTGVNCGSGRTCIDGICECTLC